MPFDGHTPKSKLLQLRDLIANVPDRQYSQSYCHTCAMGHAYRSGLIDFNPEFSASNLTLTRRMQKAALQLGLPADNASHYLGAPDIDGPLNRTEFLARLDAYIASTVLA